MFFKKKSSSANLPPQPESPSGSMFIAPGRFPVEKVLEQADEIDFGLDETIIPLPVNQNSELPQPESIESWIPDEQAIEAFPETIELETRERETEESETEAFEPGKYETEVPELAEPETLELGKNLQESDSIFAEHEISVEPVSSGFNPVFEEIIDPPESSANLQEAFLDASSRQDNELPELRNDVSETNAPQTFSEQSIEPEMSVSGIPPIPIQIGKSKKEKPVKAVKPEKIKPEKKPKKTKEEIRREKMASKLSDASGGAFPGIPANPWLAAHQNAAESFSTQPVSSPPPQAAEPFKLEESSVETAYTAPYQDDSEFSGTEFSLQESIQPYDPSESTEPFETIVGSAEVISESEVDELTARLKQESDFAASQTEDDFSGFESFSAKLDEPELDLFNQLKTPSEEETTASGSNSEHSLEDLLSQEDSKAEETPVFMSENVLEELDISTLNLSESGNYAEVEESTLEFSSETFSLEDILASENVVEDSEAQPASFDELLQAFDANRSASSELPELTLNSLDSELESVSSLLDDNNNSDFKSPDSSGNSETAYLEWAKSLGESDSDTDEVPVSIPPLASIETSLDESTPETHDNVQSLSDIEDEPIEIISEQDEAPAQEEFEPISMQLEAVENEFALSALAVEPQSDELEAEAVEPEPNLEAAEPISTIQESDLFQELLNQQPSVSFFPPEEKIPEAPELIEVVRAENIASQAEMKGSTAQAGQIVPPIKIKVDKSFTLVIPALDHSILVSDAPFSFESIQIYTQHTNAPVRILGQSTQPNTQQAAPLKEVSLPSEPESVATSELPVENKSPLTLLSMSAVQKISTPVSTPKKPRRISLIPEPFKAADVTMPQETESEVSGFEVQIPTPEQELNQLTEAMALFEAPELDPQEETHDNELNLNELNLSPGLDWTGEHEDLFQFSSAQADEKQTDETVSLQTVNDFSSSQFIVEEGTTAFEWQAELLPTEAPLPPSIRDIESMESLPQYELDPMVFGETSLPGISPEFTAEIPEDAPYFDNGEQATEPLIAPSFNNIVDMTSLLLQQSASNRLDELDLTVQSSETTPKELVAPQPESDKNEFGFDDFDFNLNLPPVDDLISDMQLQPLESYKGEDLDPDESDVQIIEALSLDPKTQLLLIYHEGTYALMSDNLEESVMLTSFDSNPLQRDPRFEVAPEAVVAGKQLYIVTVGKWQGILAVENNAVKLQAHL